MFNRFFEIRDKRSERKHAVIHFITPKTES